MWGLAAAIRLLYLSVADHFSAAQPGFTIYYWDAASSLLRDGSLSLDGVQTSILEPLYPLFLAAVRSVVGDQPVIVQAIQACTASAGAVYLYKLTMALTSNTRAAIAAAALFAVYPLLVRHSIDGTESALLTTLLVVFAHQFVTMRTAGGAAAAGAWLGLAILTRVVALPLLLLAPLMAAARGRRMGGAMAGAALLVLAPYSIRNYMLNGAVVPTRGGVNLLIANNEYAAGVIARFGPDILLPYADARLAAAGLADLPPTASSEPLWDAAYRRLAFADIRARPVATLRLKLQNVWYFFSPRLVPSRITTGTTRIHLGDNGRSTVEGSIPRPFVQHVVYSVSYGVVILLAIGGIWRRRAELARDGILWCVLLTFAAVHVAFFPSTRYRAPVDFVFLFYAGIGAAALWERRLRPHIRSNATAA